MSRALWIALIATALGCSSPQPESKRAEPEDGAGHPASRPTEREAAEPAPEPEPESEAPAPEPKAEPEVANRSPQAKVEPSTVKATVGQPISLDASASSDPDGRIVAYSWRVGNGTPTKSEDATFTHTFHEAGLQTILLTVEDDGGATAVYVVQAVIKE